MAAPMKTDEAGTPQQKKHALVVSSQTLGQQGKSKSSKKAKQSTAKKKKYLKAPFKYEWSIVQESTSKEIVELLKTTFEREGLCKALCTKGGKNVTKDKEPMNESWQHLMFGINKVTRALERKNCSLMLVDGGAQPLMLTKHLVELCMINRVPGAKLADLSTVEEIHNDNLKTMITNIISKIPRIKGPLEPETIPTLDLSQDSDEEISDDEIDPFVLPDRPTLPPDDIDFSTLYVFKKDLETFSVQENFISLSSTFKRKEESNTAAHRTSHHKKLRYMDTQIGEVKNNPARKNKSQKKKGLKNK